jgi:S-(hydroxymethyl)glutathione dehydrogenase / alcohol dehydrogenase
VTPGSTVAVLGAGGVGLSVVEGARITGARRIIVIDTNGTKEAVARQSGATDFVNPAEVENIVQHIVALTGMGVDYAFECVGNVNLIRQALEMTHPAWGKAMIVGVVQEGQTTSLAPNTMYAGRTLTGSLMGGAKLKDVGNFVDMYLAGDYSLDHIVSHRLALEDINSGVDMMKTGESVRSVIVMSE